MSDQPLSSAEITEQLQLCEKATPSQEEAEAALFLSRTNYPRALRQIEALTEERDEALDFIRRSGHRRCDSPACNCNSWHGGHAMQRLAEISDELPWTNGPTILERCKSVIMELSAAREDRDRFQSELAALRAQHAELTKCPSCNGLPHVRYDAGDFQGVASCVACDGTGRGDVAALIKQHAAFEREAIAGAGKRLAEITELRNKLAAARKAIEDGEHTHQCDLNTHCTMCAAGEHPIHMRRCNCWKAAAIAALEDGR